MWRSKKFIVIALLATVLLVGSIGGVALAQTENGDDSQPESKYGAQLDRACEIYKENTGIAIDSVALKDALVQAQSEMLEEALGNHLQNLVDQGEVTQDQADQYLEWWQVKPDVTVQFGFHGQGGFRGMGKPCGWGGLSAPTQP